MRIGEQQAMGHSLGRVQARGCQENALHANWQRLIQFCTVRRHMTLTLNIADGVPVSAEQALEKIRFDVD